PHATRTTPRAFTARAISARSAEAQTPGQDERWRQRVRVRASEGSRRERQAAVHPMEVPTARSQKSKSNKPLNCPHPNLRANRNHSESKINSVPASGKPAATDHLYIQLHRFQHQTNRRIRSPRHEMTPKPRRPPRAIVGQSARPSRTRRSERSESQGVHTQL